MKAYFKHLSAQVITPKISKTQIEDYRNDLLAEMVKLGASEDELGLVCDNMIVNSIMNNRRADDVAWAILQ